MVCVAHLKSIHNTYSTSRTVLSLKELGERVGTAERMLQAFQYGTLFSHAVKGCKGDACFNIYDKFGSARSALGAVRAIFPATKLATEGHFKVYSSKDIKKAEKEGNLQPFMQKGAWKKVAVDESGKPQKNANGDYIYVGPNAKGTYLKKDFLDVILDVFVLFARILALPNLILTQMKAFGKHAAHKLGNVIMSLWTVILTLGFAKGFWDLMKETDPEEIQKQSADLGVSFVDFATIWIDVWGVGVKVPEAAMAGSLLCLGASIGAIVYALYYA